MSYHRGIEGFWDVVKDGIRYAGQVINAVDSRDPTNPYPPAGHSTGVVPYQAGISGAGWAALALGAVALVVLLPRKRRR